MERQCSECDADITNRHTSALVCGSRCRSARANRLGVHAQRRAFFDLHRWTCGICGDPIDDDLTGRDPDGPTVDHILPRHAGGSDDPQNLQAAHRRCNEAKAGRIPWWLV